MIISHKTYMEGVIRTQQRLDKNIFDRINAIIELAMDDGRISICSTVKVCDTETPGAQEWSQRIVESLIDAGWEAKVMLHPATGDYRVEFKSLV